MIRIGSLSFAVYILIYKIYKNSEILVAFSFLFAYIFPKGNILSLAKRTEYYDERDETVLIVFYVDFVLIHVVIHKICNNCGAIFSCMDWLAKCGSKKLFEKGRIKNFETLFRNFRFKLFIGSMWR